MNISIHRCMRNIFLVALLAVFLTACGTVGDTADVKKANELAIACETDKALKAVERAAAGGGLSSHIADLQRVVFLRDAGRMSEAEAAMAERNKRMGADAEAAEEAERAVSESLEELRAEREKQTGRRTSTQTYIERLREKLAQEYPLEQFLFVSGGIVNLALNEGIPVPISVQVSAGSREKCRE